MNTRTLIALAIAAGVMNPVAAVISVSEHMKDSEPVLLALFVLPWLAGAYLIRRGKLVPGGVVISLLALLDLVSAPGWQRTSVLDWTSQGIAAALAACCLAGSIVVLVRRGRSAALAGAAR
jgi:hypothetical protein